MQKNVSLSLENSHDAFLGGGATVMSPCYPSRLKESVKATFADKLDSWPTSSRLSPELK